MSSLSQVEMPGCEPQQQQQTDKQIYDTAPLPAPVTSTEIDPVMALALRLRWLEVIILGVKPEIAGPKTRGKGIRQSVQHDVIPQVRDQSETLCRMTENVQKKLDEIVQGNEGLRRFMEEYDQHAHLLTPAFALSGVLPDPPSSEMSTEEIDALLTEMELDIRGADRDMREIEALEAKGVTGAGRLIEHEDLKPRLRALLDAQRENAEHAARLEKRVAGIVEKYTTHVDILSDLFVEWDDTLNTAEKEIAKLEKEREERRRLGFEPEASTPEESAIATVNSVEGPSGEDVGTSKDESEAASATTSAE